MTDCEIDKQEIEDFIEDWYGDEKSHKFAQDLCKYLFQFIDHLYKQGLSEKTVQKHLDNCWSIGILDGIVPSYNKRCVGDGDSHHS